jgi:Sulfatase
MTDDHRLGRLRDVLAPILLIVLPLCLFGPHTIFSGNQQEFSAPFRVLIRPVLLAGVGVAAALVAIGFVLPQRVFRVFVALLFGFGLALWIQANFLVAEYGAFTGAPIDWSIESWRNPYEIALWIAVPVLSVAATKHIFPIAPFASATLVALQTAALISTAVRSDALTATWEGPSEAMFELSTTRNVIHLVLDGFQSDVFGEILAEDRSTLDQSLSGLVFFANHTGAFPTTIASIPAMLTGKVYRNDRPLQRYIHDILKEGSLFTSLRAGGYRVDSATGMHHGKESASNYHHIPRPYVSYDDYTRFTGWQLADLSVFRHAPHVLRPWIYNDQSWRLQSLFGPLDTSARRHHPVNGAIVLEEFARRMKPATEQPLYKYIHVGIPHRPVAVDANCEFIGVVRATRSAYKAQARCAVLRTAEILARLKEAGVYDKTLVVISSDHGIGFPPSQLSSSRQSPMGPLSTLAGKALALLAVKPFNSQGPVRISSAPSSITDIPATVLDAVGVPHDLPGESALKLAERSARVRAWAAYDWERESWSQNYFDTMDIVEIDGPVLDESSWTLNSTIYGPTANDDSRTRGLYEIHSSRSGPDYRWSMPNVFFHVPAETRSFEIKVRSIAPQPQTVTVSAGDQVLGTVTLSDQSWVTVKHALPAPGRPDAHWVHLNVAPSWRPRGTTRTLGVQTRDLILGP